MVWEMASHSTDKAVQIAKFENGRCYLDAKKIEEIVQQNKVEDLPIAVLSIAGVARSGKSFLLNFMIAYLEHLSEHSEEDFGKSLQNISGIDWTGGHDAVTKGMWMCDKAFVLTTGVDTKVAILLADSQGIGDAVGSASEGVDSLILYVSLSIATIQIHNIKDYWRIEERRVYEVCGCIEDLCYRTDRKVQHLFNSLILLRRDWTGDENFGNRPTSFNEQLKKAEENPRASEIMAGIDKGFKSKDSFMLPEPSKVLKSAKQPINMKDIGEDFCKYMVEFCNCLFKSEGSYHEYIHQAKPGKMFLEDIKDVAMRLSKRSWPSLGSAADQMKDFILSKALRIAKEHFIKKAEEASHENVFENLRNLLAEALMGANQLFEANAAPLEKNEELYKKYQRKLEKDNEKVKDFFIHSVGNRIMEETLLQLSEQKKTNEALKQTFEEREKELSKEIEEQKKITNGLKLNFEMKEKDMQNVMDEQKKNIEDQKQKFAEKKKDLKEKLDAQKKELKQAEDTANKLDTQIRLLVNEKEAEKKLLEQKMVEVKKLYEQEKALQEEQRKLIEMEKVAQEKFFEREKAAKEEIFVMYKESQAKLVQELKGAQKKIIELTKVTQETQEKHHVQNMEAQEKLFEQQQEEQERRFALEKEELKERFAREKEQLEQQKEQQREDFEKKQKELEGRGCFLM